MIPYGRQSINQDDIDAVVKALRGDFLTTGPLVEKFESELEKIVGAPCVSVTSGTAALHCAYAAIGLKPGDEIITPPITFIATQATAAIFGAKIVFVDIQENTGNIDPLLVEAAITPNTKAIVAVDYAGQPADLDELRMIADKHNLILIEDAAHSLGSTYKGRSVGSIADLTTFSFFPTKNMTTAEGGAVSSINPELLSKARKFSRQGLIRNAEEFKIKNQGSWHQEVHEFGVNYRLPDVLCALGISQLSRLYSFKSKRQELFDHYMNQLSNIPSLTLPQHNSHNDVMWHLFPIRVPSTHRREIFDELRNRGIFVQVNYLPAYRHPVFSSLGFEEGDFPLSDNYFAGEISLPIYNDLEVSQQDFVIQSVLEIFENKFSSKF
jgi:UDP-4-amino-4,6-dideoxy-N-acetyl-beta-L-altrosamine transaminase